MGVLRHFKILQYGSGCNHSEFQVFYAETLERLRSEMFQQLLSRTLLRKHPVVELECTPAIAEMLLKLRLHLSVAQHLLGALVSGGGSAGACVPGLFEPVFEGGVLSSVGNGLFPFGRQFINGATLDDSAKVATGFIVLEVSHGYGVNPSAVVKKFSDEFGHLTNTDTTKTVLPLYLIENGAMTIDCRALLALAKGE